MTVITDLAQYLAFGLLDIKVSMYCFIHRNAQKGDCLIYYYYYYYIPPKNEVKFYKVWYFKVLL